MDLAKQGGQDKLLNPKSRAFQLVAIIARVGRLLRTAHASALAHQGDAVFAQRGIDRQGKAGFRIAALPPGQRQGIGLLALLVADAHFVGQGIVLKHMQTARIARAQDVLHGNGFARAQQAAVQNAVRHQGWCAILRC